MNISTFQYQFEIEEGNLQLILEVLVSKFRTPYYFCFTNIASENL